MEPVKLPRHCDEPQQFLIWSVDEMAPLMVMFVLGFIIEKILICTVIGFFFVRTFRKFKDSRPDGYLMHMLYWYGLGVTKSHSVGNPFRRNFTA